MKDTAGRIKRVLIMKRVNEGGEGGEEEEEEREGSE